MRSTASLWVGMESFLALLTILDIGKQKGHLRMLEEIGLRKSPAAQMKIFQMQSWEYIINLMKALRAKTPPILLFWIILEGYQMETGSDTLLAQEIQALLWCLLAPRHQNMKIQLYTLITQRSNLR